MFLADMRQNPSPSSLARKTWVKWNWTLVNRWKKNNVALYSPSNVRMLWADATLFSSYEAVLPPAPPVRSASKESPLSAGDPTTCPPCQMFLADMRQNPSPSPLARKTWVKWNRTLVNRWKKNNVALYSPSNVRMLLWADPTLFSSYEAVLPPAPPARSASKESLLSATSLAPPGDDGGDQDRSSPWSGFDDELPPNQKARPALTPQPAPGPSSLPLPTQPPPTRRWRCS